MLKSVEIQNFRSIKQIKLDLTYGLGRAPNGYETTLTMPFIEMSKGVQNSRLVPCFIMYGANASGKTNILKAIHLMTSLLKNRFNPWIHFQPNVIIEELRTNVPSKVVCKFYVESCLFEYQFSVCRQGIIDERLFVDGDELFVVENANLIGHAFIQKDNEIKDTFQTRCVDVNNRVQIRTFLNAFSTYLPGVSEQVNTAYHFLTESLVIIPNAAELDFIEVYENLFDQLSQEESIALKESLNSYLTKLDFNIIGFDYRKEPLKEEFLSKIQEQLLKFNFSLENLPEKRLYARSILTSHWTNHHNEVKLNFHDESLGTQKAVNLMLVLLKAIRTGQTVLIDELDSSIHTFLLRVLIRMFTDRDANTNKSQLIANVQNPELLSDDLLSSSELGFVSYSKNEGSSLYRPVSDKHLRKSDNFRKAYLRGDWGGIPFPFI